MRYAFLLAISMVFSATALSIPAHALEAELRPGFLNGAEYESLVGSLIISTDRPQTCVIETSGIPDSWILTEGEVRVSGERSVAYNIRPEKRGSYEILFSVMCGSDELVLEQDLWVGSGGSVDIPDDNAETDFFSGMVSAAGAYSHLFLVSAGVIVLFIASVFLGLSFFRREREEKFY